jgi:CRP-like cAMP-binding protein
MEATMQRSHFRNLILCHLDARTIERLELQPVTLPLNREIEFPGQPIDHLFFLEEGMASMTTTFLDGFQVEVALAGPEGSVANLTLWLRASGALPYPEIKESGG